MLAHFPQSLPKPVVSLFTGLSIALLTCVAYHVEPDVAFSAFYILPIAWATWKVSRNAGLMFASAAILLWLIADLQRLPDFSNPLNPYLNAIMRFCTLAAAVFLVSQLKMRKSVLEKKVEKRTARLLAEIETRRVAEDSLRMTQFTVDRCAEAILWEESDGRFFYVNTAACDLLGYTREELLALSVFDVNPVFTPESWRENWEELKRAGSNRTERTWHGKNGRACSVELRGNFLNFEGRAFNVVFARDISQRKRQESELRTTRERFQRMLDASPAVIYTLDPEWLLPTWVSRNVGRVLGFADREELPDGSWLDRIHPEDRERFLDDTRKLADTDAAGRDFRIRFEDGGYRWVHDRARVVRDIDGRVIEIIGSWVDINDRKETQSRLAEWKNRYEAAIQATGHILYDYDPETDRLTYAGNVEKTLGYAVEELKGGLQGWLSLVHPDDRPEVMALCQRSKIAQSPLHAQYRMQKKDGSFVHVRDDGYFVPGTGGCRPHLIGFIADVSEQRAMEMRLRHSQKMQAFGTLAGGVAHDFNNLLTVISGYTQMVAADMPADHPQRELISEIESAAERAASLTSQLLAFSRQQPAQLRVLDANQVIADVSKMLHRLIGEDIQLSTVLASPSATVKADLGQLEQVLINLSVNARDAMPKGGRLVIETSREQIREENPEPSAGVAPGDYIVLSVTDTGVGMAEDIRAHIFEPFFTTKPPGCGTGLGLATCYGIVKQSGGEIVVESEPGQGATFKVYLPEVKVSTPANPQAPEHRSMPGGTETVLVVEDDATVLRLAVAVLSAAGYHVLEASNGEEAFKVLEKNEVRELDLLLTDLVMPEMGGKDLSFWVRTAFPDAKILLISGYPIGEQNVEGLFGPDCEFMPKPFSPSDLARRVRKLLDHGTESLPVAEEAFA